MQHRTFFAGLVIAVAAILSQGTTAHASSSTLSVGGLGNSLNAGATSLLDATSITAALTIAENTGTGSYSGITLGTVGSAFTLDLTNLQSFTFSIGGIAFTPNAASSLDTITFSSATSLDVYLRGDFGGADSSISFAASYTAPSVSTSFTLDTPPLALPEPTSVIMGLTSVLGCGLMYVHRRRSSKTAA